MVKGYEFAKDQYVQFKPEEIKSLEEVGTQMMENPNSYRSRPSIRSSTTKLTTSRLTRAPQGRPQSKQVIESVRAKGPAV
jgi:hypothetical protein